MNSSTKSHAKLRVASLLPSATEMVCALGMESSLVGVSHECDWPTGVSDKPVLTSTKIMHSADSRAIDRDVRRVLEDALAVYDIDVEALRRAAPDVIVTQDLCDVCAVSFDDVRAAAEEVVPGARIVNLHPTRLSDIWSDILHVGRALDRETIAEEVVQALRDRVEAVRVRAAEALERSPEAIERSEEGGTARDAARAHPADRSPFTDRDSIRQPRPALDHPNVPPPVRAHGLTPVPPHVSPPVRTDVLTPVRPQVPTPGRPHVLTIEWIDPVMVGGTWMPELIEIAGARALVTQAGDHAPTLTLEELQALDPAPEVVLIKPCGFKLERTLAEVERLREILAGLDWPAVREHRVWLADGNAYFNRPGPRIVESLEILAACVHPETFDDFARRHALSCVRIPRR